MLLIESQTPAAPSTCHTIATETTVTTAKAIDSRNAVFITDHGSIRVSRRRARRGPRGAGLVSGGAEAAVTVGEDGAGGGSGGPTGRAWAPSCGGA